MLKLLKNFRIIDWIMAVGIIIFVWLQVKFELMLADNMGEIITKIQMYFKLENTELISDVLRIGLKMLLWTLLDVVCVVIIGYFSTMIGSRFSFRLRQKLFAKVQRFSVNEFNKFSTPSLITRSTNDIRQVRMAITMFLRICVTAPIMAEQAMSKIIGKSGELTMITLFSIIFIVVLIAVIFTLCVPRFTVLQKLTDKLNGVSRENLKGLRVVRAYNAENYQEEKFNKANKELIRTMLFVDRATSLMNPGMNFVMSLSSLLIYWLGASLIVEGGFSSPVEGLSVVATFSMYSTQVIMSFMMMTMIFIMLPRAIVSARRINEVLGTKDTIIDPVNPKTPEKKGEIEFRNVSFGYMGAVGNVVSNVSFSAKQGETVAVIGSTGCGKTTLVNLIPRFYDCTSGEVLVDGVNVKELSQKELRSRIGYVPQKAVLFTGDIEENVLYGNANADASAVQKALEVAQAKEFVDKLDDGINAEISQGGANVSGGQRQRLCIARAIAKKPEIYIFDDSFSALDFKTDKQLRSALKEYTSNSTCIIVAQRIGTIMNADKILVMDSGAIVGQGTHDELLKNCSVYREIAMSQLQKEEL